MDKTYLAEIEYFCKKNHNTARAMAKILFITHPYTSPKNLKGTICGWNTTESHCRKLLHSLEAKYIDSLGGTPKKGEIIFVGEWECCSECSEFPTTDEQFKKLHKPFLTVLDSWRHVLSTDPFVFGPKFFHSCCKISYTKDLVPGDIVLFGSYRKKTPNKILLDTVLVLAENITPLEKAEHSFPYGYSHTTLSRLHPMHSVWEGKMYDDITHNNDRNDIFSFVPCLPISNKTTTPSNIPCMIDDTIYGQKIKAGRMPCLLEFLGVDSLTVFNEIASKVTTAGFCLGVQIPMPKKREIYDILK